MRFVDVALSYFGLNYREPGSVQKQLPDSFRRSIDNILNKMLLERDHEKLRQYEAAFNRILEHFSIGKYDSRHIGAARLDFFNISPLLPDYHNINARKYHFKLIKS